MSQKISTLAKDLRKTASRKFHYRYLGEIEQTAVALEITFRAVENNGIRKGLSES